MSNQKKQACREPRRGDLVEATADDIELINQLGNFLISRFNRWHEMGVPPNLVCAAAVAAAAAYSVFCISDEYEPREEQIKVAGEDFCQQMREFSTLHRKPVGGVH